MQETAESDLLQPVESAKQASKRAFAWQKALAKVQAQQETAAAAGDKNSSSGASCHFAGDGTNNVPSIIQQHVSLPTPTAPAPPRLAVMIHTAMNLPGSSSRELQRAGMYVKAAVHRQSQSPAAADKAKTHLALQADGSVAWNSLLTFSPAEPADMMLTMSLRHKQGLATVLWGVASVSLQAVMSDPAAWNQKQQLVLDGHRLQGLGALLEVQLFLSTDSIQGPLSVLAATWNVGNAVPPPPEVLLNSWLKGAAESRHHLIAVGAQECNYSKDLRRDVSRRRSKTPDTSTSVHNISKANESSNGAAAATEQAVAAIEAAAFQQGLAATDTDEDAAEDGVILQESAASAASLPGAAVPVAAVGNLGLTAVTSLKLRSARSRVKNYLWEQVDSAAVWERHITAALGQRYWLVSSKHMFQTRLLLFARVDVVPYISHTTTAFEATGIGHVGLNKGGVMTSLKLDNTSLAFVCSHLAAQQSKTAQRNSDLAEICAGLHLPAGSAAGAAGSDIMTGFHHVVWVGDLNYRLEYGQQAVTHLDSPTLEDYDSLCADISEGKFPELLQLDQLQREQTAGHVFVGFREGQIGFPPTFKVLKGQSGFIYTPKRSPAWCDRVLFKSALPHNQIVCNSYYAAPDISTSDHKPVAAQLSVPLVTNTVTSGRVTGRVPFKLYVTSVRLQGADSWHWLEELPVGPAAAGQAAGAGNAGSQMSSSTGNKRQQGAVRQRRLKLVLSGACLAGLRQTHSMKVDTDALAMAFSDAVATALPNSSIKDPHDSGTQFSLLLREESMALLPGAIQDLQDDWLLLRIVSVEGLKHRTLALGVVPLQSAVAEYQNRSFKPVHVPVQLERHGATAGAAVVSLQLISSQAARQGMYEAIRRMRALAHLRSHSPMARGIATPQLIRGKSTRAWSESKVHGWLGGNWWLDNYTRMVEGLRPLAKPGMRTSSGAFVAA